MLEWDQIKQAQLDIVGIVAILGEGSTTRNAQASALGWHYVLPRLLPAPQALLKHDREKRLPTIPGTVVGAYSGRVKFELNHFCQLLHQDDLGPNQVQLVHVKHSSDTEELTGSDTKDNASQQKGSSENDESDDEDLARRPRLDTARSQAFYLKRFSGLVFLSLLGFCMSIVIAVLSYLAKDGFAFLATFFLSVTSSIVGFASWWRLDFREEVSKNRPQKDRKRAIPDSDLVIYYPRQGAFRIVRCKESIAGLYFKPEKCEYAVDDNVYRVAALWASLFLMSGLLCLSNSKAHMQIIFAASYMGLNVLYWGFSAVNPMKEGSGYWRHPYHPREIPVVLPSVVPDRGSPLRTDTVRSLQNQSAIPLRTASILPASEARKTDSPTSVSPTETGPPNDYLSPNLTSIRHRKVTFQDNVSATNLSNRTKESTLVGNPHAGATPSEELPPLETSALSDVMHAEARKEAKRNDTKDVEGMKIRPKRPGGSLIDRWIMLLDRHRLIPKQYRKSPRDNDRKDDSFTTALWKAIAITGSTLWLQNTHIAADNEVWRKWIDEAGRRAAAYNNKQGNRVAAYKVDRDGNIQLPSWGYEGRLTELFAEQSELHKRRPPIPAQLKDPEIEEGENVQKLKNLSPWIEQRLKALATDARRHAKARKLLRGNTMPKFDERPQYNDHEAHHVWT